MLTIINAFYLYFSTHIYQRSNILSTYASTLNYFITLNVLLNHVSPIIKFADLHKACQTSKGEANAQLPTPLAAPLILLNACFLSKKIVYFFFILQLAVLIIFII